MDPIGFLSPSEMTASGDLLEREGVVFFFLGAEKVGQSMSLGKEEKNEKD